MTHLDIRNKLKLGTVMEILNKVVIDTLKPSAARLRQLRNQEMYRGGT